MPLFFKSDLKIFLEILKTKNPPKIIIKIMTINK
jgi:hypothetical protein